MTAEEIRSRYKWDYLEPAHANLVQVEVLSEIAAQLAEANGLKRMEMGVEPEPEPESAPAYTGPTTRTVTEADYAEMLAIIQVARELVQDHALVSTSTGLARKNFDKLDQLFESFDSIPF